MFKWNYEQHLYTHTLIPIINRFASTNEPLSVAGDMCYHFLSDPCHDGWSVFGSSYYAVFDQHKLTWQDARVRVKLH